jgi:hypothetical protein
MMRSDFSVGRIDGCTRAARVRTLVPALLTLGLLGVCSQVAHAQRITLNGSASLAGGVLRLTPAEHDRTGSAWLTARQSVQGGFETTFQFRISSPGGGTDLTGATGADGFAFVVQNASLSALGFGGGGIGYAGIPNSLAVEFDTWLNGPSPAEGGDPNSNHVSVHTGGTGPNGSGEGASIGLATGVPNLSDGRVHLAAIRYTAPSDTRVPPAQRGLLRVAVDGINLLSIRLDLAQLLSLTGGGAFVGFTAATGGAFENHDILSWSFRSL